MKRSFLNRFPEKNISEEEGINLFLNRINDIIFKKIYNDYNYDDFFEKICIYLGEKSGYYKKQNFGGGNDYKGLEHLTKRDFLITLEVLEYCPSKYFEIIEIILNMSKRKDNIDLGIRFHKGIFYKAGDKDLDEIILDNSVDNISIYDKARKHYQEALVNYSSGKYSEALTNCYTTIEKLAQDILGNSKTLGNNQGDLIKFLKNGKDGEFVKQWREILKHLCIYLHDFSTRHGSKIEGIDEMEVDATIYLVGTIINLLSKKNKLNKQSKNDEQTKS